MAYSMKTDNLSLISSPEIESNGLVTGGIKEKGNAGFCEPSVFLSLKGLGPSPPKEEKGDLNRA